MIQVRQSNPEKKMVYDDGKLHSLGSVVDLFAQFDRMSLDILTPITYVEQGVGCSGSQSKYSGCDINTNIEPNKHLPSV